LINSFPRCASGGKTPERETNKSAAFRFYAAAQMAPQIQDKIVAMTKAARKQEALFS
jgi:hypothetical protein